MKQVITLLIATVFTLTSFASGKPFKAVYKIDKSSIVENKTAALTLTLKSAGKVNLNWTAIAETTTTVYKIERSLNGSAFKTVALLMGESNESYNFRDSVKDITGKVIYRVVTMDNNTTIGTLTQNLVIL